MKRNKYLKERDGDLLRGGREIYKGESRRYLKERKGDMKRREKEIY